MVMEIDHPEVPVRSIGCPVKLRGMPRQLRRLPPLPGAHRDRILAPAPVRSRARWT